MHLRACAVAAILLAGCSGFGTAQAAPACDGKLAILRISSIKEGGTMDGFRQAVQDHEAWYRSHGAPDSKQIILPVIRSDRKTGENTVSPTEIVTLQLNPPPRDKVPAGKDDPARNDYIAKYKANSDLEDTKTVCLPADLFK